MSRQNVSPPGINSCERIRPERSRNTIQRLVWGPGSQFQVGHIGIPEDEGSNPRMALRRLLRLYEGRQYREAAGFLMKLPHYTLKAALTDIPVDLLIETLPHSLILLEALYSRLVELNVSDTKILRIEQVLWRIVHLISTSHDHSRPRIWCKLLVSLNRLSPNTKNILISRKRALERAVEGLGKHGLVPSSQTNNSENSVTSNLVPLPVALKEELETRMETYKLALHKIENFGKHAGTHKADQGVQAASHQRQLSLKYSEIQQRLIDNQSLLNTLEKAGGPCSLENLLAELKRRVEQDKEALRQWTALRNSTFVSTNAKNPALAARLLQFSRGCAFALQFMSEDNPQVFHLEENLGDDYEEESSSAGYHTDDSCSPTPEPVVTGSNCEILSVEENCSDLTSADITVERLAERYGALYAQANLHTLDALDALEPLKDAPDLKAKILYSVVVLSWRLAGMVQTSRRLEALKILNGAAAPQTSATTPELEKCIKRQLATSGAQTGSREVAEQVVSQLERTLYDFPCLRGCAEVKSYATACSTLAWACLARSTPLVLDVAQGLEFRREVHVRHHASPNPHGIRIRSVLWPGLREGCQGPCLHRAVVTTC
ncbi:Mitochondria-eating protein C-terminal domain-containing protein [Camponotus japonicus]